MNFHFFFYFLLFWFGEFFFVHFSFVQILQKYDLELVALGDRAFPIIFFSLSKKFSLSNLLSHAYVSLIFRPLFRFGVKHTKQSIERKKTNKKKQIPPLPFL